MNPNKTGELLFGTGGIPLSAKSRSTEAGIERFTELDLGCMELLKALKKRRAKRVILSESTPYLEKDTLLLQQTYRSLS